MQSWRGQEQPYFYFFFTWKIPITAKKSFGSVDAYIVQAINQQLKILKIMNK